MPSKESKKILWICHWESPYEEEWKGGMGKYMFKLAQELSRDYHKRIDILTPNFGDLPSPQILCPRVNLIRLDLPVKSDMRNPEDMKKYADSVLEYFSDKQDDYSLVHAHYWSSHLAGEALKEKGLPYVLQLHQLDKPMSVAFREQDLDYPLNEWRIESERIAVENSDKTIFVSQSQLREFDRDYYGGDIPRSVRNKIVVIPNGVDVDFFKPIRRANLEKLLVNHDLPSDSFVIGYCGRLDSDKAVDRILYSVPMLLDSLSGEVADKIRVMITGKGKDVKYLMDVVKELKLGNRTQFHGYQTGRSLLEKFQVADVGVIPSIHETFGLSLVEFMATGKPVIVWKGSGGPQEIVNSSAGFVVGNYEEMAKSLKKLVLNKKLKKKIGLQARKKCIEVYNWDRVAKQTFETYNELLEN